MITLGIESSCDETSASVLQDGQIILSNIIASQHDIHSLYGGVVPELACRRHMETIALITEQALSEANTSVEEIDLVAATAGPGLIVALLVGLSYGKALAYGAGKPLVGVNHLEGHILSVTLEHDDITFPFISLLVSGGHTDIYLVRDYGQYELLGRTRDDAAGEALDKGAKLLGLAYPGGPIIEKLAKKGDPQAIRFPRSYLEKGSLHFSFSGLKTSLRNYLQKEYKNSVPQEVIPDIAASYQEAVVDVLTKKVILAAQQSSVSNIVVSGGVAANGALRQRLIEIAKKEQMKTYIPKPILCTDNAAMIACAGYHRYIRNPDAYISFLDLDANPAMSL